MCCAPNDFKEEDIDGECEFCGAETCDGVAFLICGYSPCDCDHCGYSPCDGSW